MPRGQRFGRPGGRAWAAGGGGRAEEEPPQPLSDGGSGSVPWKIKRPGGRRGEEKREEGRGSRPSRFSPPFSGGARATGLHPAAAAGEGAGGAGAGSGAGGSGAGGAGWPGRGGRGGGKGRQGREGRATGLFTALVCGVPAPLSPPRAAAARPGRGAAREAAGRGTCRVSPPRGDAGGVGMGGSRGAAGAKAVRDPTPPLLPAGPVPLHPSARWWGCWGSARASWDPHLAGQVGLGQMRDTPASQQPGALHASAVGNPPSAPHGWALTPPSPPGSFPTPQTPGLVCPWRTGPFVSPFASPLPSCCAGLIQPLPCQ